MSIPNPPQNPDPNPYQQNPYGQQPPGPAAPNAFGAPPTMPAGTPIAPQGMPAGQPGFPPPAARKGVPGWLWGLGGVVVASAAWAGTLFATGALDDEGGSSATPDHAGYAYQKDICETTELAAFHEPYEPPDTDGKPTGYGTRQQGFDQSYCSWSLEKKDAAEDDYSSFFVSTTAEWEKVNDPAGVFASIYKSYEARSADGYSYEVEPVSGLGDEAFLVTETQDDGDTLSSMTLGVRAGWFTWDMRWSDYGSSDEDQASAKDVEEMLRTDTEAALAELKGS